jgi:hypothetical protein
MKNLAILILAVLFTAACSKEQNDLVGTSSSSNGLRTTQPFKADFYSTQDTDPSIPPTQCSGDLPGFANPGYFLHGTATYLGALNSAQSRGQDVTCDLSFATMLLTTTVSGQLAAANGDLIYYTGIDAIDASNYLTGQGTAGTITGTWTITGGTGRFTGATGSFTINGPVDFATGTFSYHAEGTIEY